MSKSKNLYFFIALWLVSMPAVLPSCTPDAQWETEDVAIEMVLKTVSAGFIECSFSTSKEAYYMVAIQPAEKGYDPMGNQKQFMQLALDSANIDYLNWRYRELKNGEFNIASFASHSLQYGETGRFFTNLTPDTEYWIYAFVVNPETLKPTSRLLLKTVRTTSESVCNVHFEYRVRGLWDYIYPIDDFGRINDHFPYMAATRDSAFITDQFKETPEEFFTELFSIYSQYNIDEVVLYGVHVTKNDGQNSDEYFEAGHTYYTAIVSYDGFMGNNVLYKFRWTGEDCELYMTEEDSIVKDDDDNEK